METVNSQRRFSVVAFDIQTKTAKNSDGNTKVMVIIDVFTRYVFATTIPDEKTETLAQTLLKL